jgi:Tfp pilus assembly protein PilN
MKALRIDFSSPGLGRTLHRTSNFSWLLAAVAVLLCLAAAILGMRLMAQQREDAARLDALRSRVNVVPVVVAATPVTPISELQASAVNSAVLQLNLPWRSLHDAIAAATPPEIALLALEPDARHRSIKITAETKTSDAMIAYIESLKEQELFTAVTLTRHEINELDQNRPIRFQLDAEWSAP